MKNIRQFFFLIIVGCIGFYFTSCEKDVDFDLGTSMDKVVVEGTIESGLPPYVRLSKSIGFFSNIDLETLSGSFLHDAAVYVSDDTRSIRLREYSFESNGISYYFYAPDTAEAGALSFRGIPGKSYKLEILYDGKSYQSTTTIPELTPLDSLWAEAPPPVEVPEDFPNSMLLYAKYSDPLAFGNKVRYFTSINGGTFTPPYYSVFNDDVVNGTVVNVQLESGANKMDSLNRQTSGYFYRGDTVIVKWCSIDKATYDFWQTLEFSYGSTGNPFASPVKVSTNIQGGALGVWAGYGVSYDTLAIPE